MQISSSIENNRTFFQKKLRPDISFDVVDRNLMIGGRDACLYCIDGFTKDDTLLKVLQAMSSIETAQMPDNANDFAALYLAYGEIGLETDSDALIIQLLSGVPFLLIDGYAQALTIDCRTYPARGVSEPEKDKVLRGSRDGFVETLVFNTALIRRRIRDPKLRMEIMNIGESSHTDIAICYMENRVDTELLNRIRTRIQKVHVDALSMNQESLAECIYPHKWFNPFPKFRFSERPDTSAASILEGNIIILVDNSPSAMILPSSVFDIIEEADDYYFPPLTGTYLRLSRTVIFFLTLFLTPLWLLFMQNPGWIPEWLAFIRSSARGSQHPQHADDTAQCHRRYRAWRILGQIRLVQQRDDALYGVRHDRQLLDDELRTRLRTQIHARPAPDSDLFPQSLGLHRRNTHCRRLPCL